MTEHPPLILTLQLDEQAFAFFNDLRKKHFPPAINYLDAHLTLFHHLPQNPAITEWLRTVSAKQAPIALEVTNLMKLGRGVAFGIKSEELVWLQANFKKRFQEWLTPQDRQGFRPHVTVQNKVTPEKANALFTELVADFTPFRAEGIGFSLWEYQSGPWQKVEDFNFFSDAANTYFES